MDSLNFVSEYQYFVLITLSWPRMFINTFQSSSCTDNSAIKMFLDSRNMLIQHNYELSIVIPHRKSIISLDITTEHTKNTHYNACKYMWPGHGKEHGIT